MPLYETYLDESNLSNPILYENIYKFYLSTFHTFPRIIIQKPNKIDTQSYIRPFSRTRYQNTNFTLNRDHSTFPREVIQTYVRHVRREHELSPRIHRIETQILYLNNPFHPSPRKQSETKHAFTITQTLPPQLRIPRYL